MKVKKYNSLIYLNLIDKRGVLRNGTTLWLKRWKYPAILLFGIGISNLGAWVYFIALNLIVLNMTGSPFALSVLYIIRPLAGMFANLWAGSVVDRVNKKKAMIALDLSRAVLLCVLPLADTILGIFVMTFILQAASHVFGNASGVYITKLIPEAQRPRFNSLNSLLGSGAFLVGPAIAGLLIMIGTPNFAILMNAAALFVSGLLTILMPDVDREPLHEKTSSAFSAFSAWKQDLHAVMGYYRVHRLVMAMCLLYGGLMVVMASAVDSLEAAFATIELGLSEGEYGLLVSVAGAGIVAGAVLNALVVNRLSYRSLIAVGVLGNGAGYFFYAFSHTFRRPAPAFSSLRSSWLTPIRDLRRSTRTMCRSASWDGSVPSTVLSNPCLSSS